MSKFIKSQSIQHRYQHLFYSTKHHQLRLKRLTGRKKQQELRRKKQSFVFSVDRVKASVAKAAAVGVNEAVALAFDSAEVYFAPGAPSSVGSSLSPSGFAAPVPLPPSFVPAPLSCPAAYLR